MKRVCKFWFQSTDKINIISIDGNHLNNPLFHEQGKIKLGHSRAVVFNPKKISEEIQKYGGFVPGVRPGVQTAKYLNYILTRITLAGALFLGTIAIFPTIAKSFTNIQNLMLGGTGVLIVVSVVLETIKSIEAQLVMRNYEGFKK